MTKWIVAAIVSLSFGCAVQAEEPVEGPSESSDEAIKGGNQQCALRCAAPPDGCRYEGAVTSGPCKKLTCGTLVCDGSTL